MFKKILIANRGEIAVRIIRTCEKMGIAVVTVHSEADTEALHTKLSPESYLIGPPPVAQSYLQIDAIIEIARKSGADAIHPGYGLLAENPRFAEACNKHGVTFIGPSPAAITSMGTKIESREIMRAAGIPVIPGTQKPVESLEEARSSASKLGYPVIVKASAGGGGIGMQVVEDENGLEKALKTCQGRAKANFGDGAVYLEKYFSKPRHVEIQVLADSYGRITHLNERECSIQRRHQKVIEETPSTLMDEKLRYRMGEAAIRAARAIGYINAGTVEFLIDENKNFYFLEMNTRLQVEHPVTELTTGIDLVAEQIRIAAGEPLLVESAPSPNGHAIECRLYAEDPITFIPSPGPVNSLQWPQGEHLRIDAGVCEGYKVTPFYDPLLAKIITWGETRHQACNRMSDALKGIKIAGLKTNIPLLLEIINQPQFKTGNISTNYIKENIKSKTQ